MTIEQKPAAEMSEEEARQVGEQFGYLVAGAVAHSHMLPFVGRAMNDMRKTEHSRAFASVFVTALSDGLKGGIEGFLERARMASALWKAHADLSTNATQLAVTHHKKGNAKAVEELNDALEAANHCRMAADALFSPIKENLEMLVETGRKIVLMNKLREEHTVERMAEIAEAKCDNPNCPIHGKVN